MIDHSVGNRDLIGITIVNDCDLNEFFPKFPFPITKSQIWGQNPKNSVKKGTIFSTIFKNFLNEIFSGKCIKVLK